MPQLHATLITIIINTNIFRSHFGSREVGEIKRFDCISFSSIKMLLPRSSSGLWGTISQECSD